MPLTFHPALAATTTLGLADTAADAADLELTFTARFGSHEERDRARNDKVVVQLWTDVPSPGNLPGQWGALPFLPASSVDPPFDAAAAASQTGMRAFSIAPSDDASALVSPVSAGEDELALVLRTRIPRYPARYSYTFRLVYPSGQIKWLGEYSRDGHLTVDKDSRDPRIQLAKGWTQTPRAGLAWSGAGDAVVGALDTKFQWSCWAISQDGDASFHKSLSDIPRGLSPSILVFLPERPSQSIVSVQPLILTASGISSISVSSKGHITVGTPAGTSGKLALSTHDSSWDLRSFVQNIFTGSPQKAQLVSVHPESGFALVASPENKIPVTVSVIPFSWIAPSRVFPVSARSLALLPASDRTGSAAAFSPASGQSLMLSSGSNGTTPDEGILLSAGVNGAQFVLSPAHPFEMFQESELLAQPSIVVLTPHTLADPEPEAMIHLPTPPQTPERAPTPLPSITQTLEDSPEPAVTQPLETKSPKERQPSPPVTPPPEFLAFPPTPRAILDRVTRDAGPMTWRSWTRYIIVHVIRASALFFGFLFARVFGNGSHKDGKRPNLVRRISSSNGIGVRTPTRASAEKPEAVEEERADLPKDSLPAVVVAEPEPTPAAEVDIRPLPVSALPPIAPARRAPSCAFNVAPGRVSLLVHPASALDLLRARMGGLPAKFTAARPAGEFALVEISGGAEKGGRLQILLGE